MRITKTKLIRSLVKKDLKKWLTNLDSEEEVGLPHMGDACPLHTFLSSVLDISDGILYVDHSDFQYKEEGEMNPVIAETPKWAKCFMKKVDKSQRFDNKSQMSAGIALEILGEC